MSADRRRLLGLGLGALAILIQVRLCARFVELTIDDYTALRQHSTPHLLDTRMSQFKPFAFKFPWTGLYLKLFFVVSCFLLISVWASGIRSAIRAKE
jgi:hypothetical protein